MPTFEFDRTFRSANSTDDDVLHQLIRSCWIEVYSAHVSAETAACFTLQNEVGEHLDLFISTLEVAVVNGCVVGVINHSDGFIASLFVANSFRRKRIGSSLLYNVEIAGGRYLEVAAFNYQAILFYEENGWQRFRVVEDDEFGTKLKSFGMVKTSR